mmetsp:Transcript_64768/g.163026  ORF Transcript_64768/g.163026 Transcript_64768/m.163026 type:complete len:277 (+) Transcript_64768:3772-4602(+)
MALHTVPPVFEPVGGAVGSAIGSAVHGAARGAVRRGAAFSKLARAGNPQRLLVDERDGGRIQPHACAKAAVEVLMQHGRLHETADEDDPDPLVTLLGIAIAALVQLELARLQVGQEVLQDVRPHHLKGIVHDLEESSHDERPTKCNSQGTLDMPVLFWSTLLEQPCLLRFLHEGFWLVIRPQFEQVVLREGQRLDIRIGQGCAIRLALLLNPLASLLASVTVGDEPAEPSECQRVPAARFRLRGRALTLSLLATCRPRAGRDERLIHLGAEAWLSG